MLKMLGCVRNNNGVRMNAKNLNRESKAMTEKRNDKIGVCGENLGRGGREMDPVKRGRLVKNSCGGKGSCKDNKL